MKLGIGTSPCHGAESVVGSGDPQGPGHKTRWALGSVVGPSLVSEAPAGVSPTTTAHL